MRRLFAIFMITALVAVLVPSAALAGKPLPPEIKSVTVRALASSSTEDLCRLNMEATFVKGKAVYIRFTATDGVINSTPTTTLSRLATTSSQIFNGVTLGAGVWSFKVQLLDRKFGELAVAQVGTENHTNTTSCPVAGHLLASYP